MINKFFLALCFFAISLVSFSQDNTASPYSFFGQGDVRFRGTVDARSMGGLNIAGDSIALNLQNPASYSSLRLVSFAVAGTTNFTTLKNATVSEPTQRTSIDYLAIGIPMGKFGSALGVMPYSAVGYNLRNSFTDNSNGNSLLRNRQFIGTGNINKVFFGTSYAFTQKLSMGVNLEYNFGEIEKRTRESIFDTQTDNFVQLGSRELNVANVSGLTSKFGLLYESKYKGKYSIYSSLSYVPEAKLTLDKTSSLATVLFDNDGNEISVGTGIDREIADSKLVIPSQLSLGFGVGEKYKWMIGADVSFVNSERQNNIFSESINAGFQNSQRYVLGGYYIPKYDSFSSYFSRVVYRAGMRYDSGALVYNNQAIRDYGMNFGVGLPLGFSKIDIGLELGQRGTTSQNLIKENYFNLSIGLSLSDKWFKKTLID